MRSNDICLANFPYAGGAGGKPRPVLVLAGPVSQHREWLVAYISSVIPPRPLSTDLIIDPSSPAYSSTKLKTTSVLRLHKLSTVGRSDMLVRLGRIDPAARADVDNKLRRFLNL